MRSSSLHDARFKDDQALLLSCEKADCGRSDGEGDDVPPLLVYWTSLEVASMSFETPMLMIVGTETVLDVWND